VIKILSDYGSDIETKRRVAPFLVVNLNAVAASTDPSVEHALGVQDLKDWMWSGPGRHLLYVIDGVGFAQILASSPRTLSRLGYAIEARGLAMTLLSVVDDSSEYCVAYIVSSQYLLDFPSIPRRGDDMSSYFHFFVDLCPSRVGRIDLGQAYAPRKVELPQRMGTPKADGSILTPYARRVNQVVQPITGDYRKYLLDVIASHPIVPGRPIVCQTNEFYGHSQILRDYCGIREGLPIRGRIQHGWTVGSAPMLDELVDYDQPLYVWGDRLFDSMPDKARCLTTRIGAPYLYLPPSDDPGPIYPTGMIAFPHHSINLHRLPSHPDGWRDYAQWLIGQDYDYRPITVCLYIIDYENVPVRGLFEECGFNVVTCGAVFDPDYLRRFRTLTRQHSSVTSNRLSTAIFYALHEGRTAKVAGPPMTADPPDHYEELTADPKWIAKEFHEPSAELGEQYKLPPADLKELLFGWLNTDGATPQ